MDSVILDPLPFQIEAGPLRQPGAAGDWKLEGIPGV